MITKLEIDYFRKVEHAVMILTEGLNVIRGVNEASKTTRIEAAAYALLGSRVLRNTLAEVVTWGHRENELKVVCTLEINGHDYRFSRAKAGAEVYVDGADEPYVTGQNEVTAFAASLLGAEANVAQHLMLANQGGLRGILEEGPRATSTLIEKLSDLDLIDRLLDAAQERLQLGSTAVLEDRLAVAEQTLADLVPVPAPALPDFTAREQALQTARAAVQAQLPIQQAADARLNAELKKRGEAATLDLTLRQIQQQAAEALAQQRQAEAQRQPLPDLPGLEAALQSAQVWEARHQAWTGYQQLPSQPSTPLAEFKECQRQTLASLAEAQTQLAVAKAELRQLLPQLATGTRCPTCGQDTAHLPDVQQRQAALQQAIATAQQTQARREGQLPALQAAVAQAAAAVTANDQHLQTARRWLPFVTIDETVIPAAIQWVGDPVAAGEGPDVPALQQQVATARLQIERQTKLQARIETLQGVLNACTARQQEVEATRAALCLRSEADYAQLQARADGENQELFKRQGLVALQEIELGELRQEYQKAQALHHDYCKTREAHEGSRTQLLADIEITTFNNALIKKLRAARPVIANKLWNLVLSTVSTLFSQMRGEASVVARTKDGFTVNGRSVESLSGSTLDILGLAIRCALIKTFVPHCPFLILDEPASGCDEARSAALAGFIAAAGFQQVILVTHESVTESLSANLIQL